MPDRPWKAEERHAAALFGGRRFTANTGGTVDFESRGFVGQVKHVRRLSLAALEVLALETERLGFRGTQRKCGMVVVKRSAGRGRRTPRLIVLTEAAWRALNRAGVLKRGRS